MDDLDSEFGASPLGKTDIRGGAAATTAPLEMTIVDAAPLPDIYGDLYGDTGEGNVLLKTQVAQNAELQTLKTTLTNNISTLFNTAKLEIQRKDDEIKELRGKVAICGGGGVGGGRSGVGGRSSSSRPSDRGREHSREDRNRGSSEGRDRGRERSSGGAVGGRR
ncbi:hypothetical protein NADE_002495 [Nannochloris sp. 'desiccata']|nr:hypothetical protein KSW81_005784 [Chlorella desiccata (nom. nud.)]KAH7623305.1 hypothetical protein NADE_002495 [Chlorella desiccata (nom. nud.)]